MKHFILVLAAAFTFTQVSAQSDRYTKTMEEKIAVLESTRKPDELKELAHAFERIARAEKKEWHPFYYAALAQLNMAYNLLGTGAGNISSIDPITDKAEELIKEAEALSPDNPELFILKKMAHSLRFMVDPQNRYMRYGPLAQAALEKAKSLDPENPRVYLLEGQDKFFTPEAYGGSKAEAKKLFELAMQKFDARRPASSIAPAWGRGTLQYFLTQANQN